MSNQKIDNEMIVKYEQIFEVLTDAFSRLEEIKETKPYTFKTFMWAFISGFDSIKPHVDEGEVGLSLAKAQELIAKEVIFRSGKELKELFYKEVVSQQKQISEEVFHE